MRPSPVIQYNESLRAEYQKLSTNKSLSGRLLNYSHYLLEKTLVKNKYSKIIEVGSGFGTHFEYIRSNFDYYLMTDYSDVMFKEIKTKHIDAIKSGKLAIEIQDARKIKYDDSEFDRLIATHVLEHLADPVDVLSEWNRVVKNQGIISIVLPCDPGLLWRFGRNLGPRRNAIKEGFEYDYQQAAEHINSIFNLVTFIKYHFSSIQEKWYPSFLPFADINLFYICHIKVNK
jgi:phosphatidylethanolamine/phosphatidyl-N-methylethanolamine N-methyltransferase